MAASQLATQLADDLLGLFYPKLCYACGCRLSLKSEPICLDCAYRLPKTNFHFHKENPFTERLWGRVDVQAAAACFHFVKSGRVQRLLHQLKYGGQWQVGLYLGQNYGEALKSSQLFQRIDKIVPVPLHPRRQHQRGYNQSAAFARGLSESMNVPWEEALERRVHTNTQTRKSRMGRFGNVEGAFRLRPGSPIDGQHILLVDDVVTTGATLEACAHTLLQAAGSRLSMATIAIAG